eukprot:scaffold286992_cov31-Tisochrysis_lutea.AAC.2
MGMHPRTFLLSRHLQGRRARFDYDRVPHMPPKSFVRRYDLGWEWMVTELLDSKKCQLSKLREAMPMPRFPDSLQYIGRESVRGVMCNRWREEYGAFCGPRPLSFLCGSLLGGPALHMIFRRLQLVIADNAATTQVKRMSISSWPRKMASRYASQLR